MKKDKKAKIRYGNMYPKKYGYIFIVPAVSILVLISIVPTIYSIVASFTNYNLVKGKTKFIGLENYVDIFSDPRFWQAVGRTFLYVLIVVSVELIIGFSLAVLFQINFKGKKIIRSLIILPMVATPVAIAFMWRIMYNPNLGILNYLLGVLGIPAQDWVSNQKTALMSIMIVDIWQWTPFLFLILSSGIASLPTECFEAAEMDGANFFQTIFKVMVPLLKPIIAIGILFRIVDAFKAFDIIFILTAGGPGTATETMNILVYLSGFRHFKIGYACALALIMIYTVVYICSFIMKKTDFKFE